MGFRKDFIWGAGTSAYQVEGRGENDGKGDSVWDVMAHESGRIKDGVTGDVACDHYHRFKEDVALMKELGLKSYRFSIAWTRIIPEGVGQVNQKGIDFYNALIDELIAAGIKPCITLFHWDYPEALEKLGGWQNPDSHEWFRAYTEVVVKAFGDRVKMYVTLNEPQCFLGAYTDGYSAPGKSLPMRYVIGMMHNAFIAHGLAVKEIRKYVKDAFVGFAPTCGVNIPLTDSPEDVEASRRQYYDIDPSSWVWNLVLWSDPLLLGSYPEHSEAFKNMIRPHLPKTYEKDLETIFQPLDFCGQNIYNGSYWKAGEDGKAVWVNRHLGASRTAIGWPVTPEALYWGPKFLYERYKKPVIICENGISCCDTISIDGKVHDPERIDFAHRYLRELKRAADDGVDIAGYYHWSIMDNVEWLFGYTERFGLIYVDFPTQKRIRKDSYEWYKGVIAENGENL